MLDRPQGEGKETPGAYAGSAQSRSIEIYFLLLQLLDRTLFAIQEIPNLDISIGVITSNPTLSAFSNSSGSAALVQNLSTGTSRLVQTHNSW